MKLTESNAVYLSQSADGHILYDVKNKEFEACHICLSSSPLYTQSPCVLAPQVLLATSPTNGARSSSPAEWHI